ncbi:MAG: flagellar filament capping protein FliD, partial [Gammaproteobacteria bacterium]
RTAVETLADPATFSTSRATVADEGVLGVTADAEASPGSLAVDVLRLADHHRMASDAKAAADTVGGTAGDTLQITVGGDTLTVDLSGAKTLAEIRDLINEDTGGVGVTASLLDEAGDGSQQRLVLNARGTGYDDRLQLSYAGTLDATTLGFATLNRDADGAPLTELNLAELDASLRIDGFTLTRSGNRVDDAVSGLAFDLTQVGSTRVHIAQDDTVIVSAVSGVVDSYNAMKAQLDALSDAGFSGDSLLRSIPRSIRAAMNQAFAGFGDFAVLTELGVGTTREGTLEFDSARLAEALSDNRTGVAGFFSGESGFGASLVGVLDGYLERSGIFDARIEGLNRRASDLQNQQESWENRLILVEDRLRRQFSALDGLIARLTNTSTYLAQQLASLPGFDSGRDR